MSGIGIKIQVNRGSVKKNMEMEGRITANTCSWAEYISFASNLPGYSGLIYYPSLFEIIANLMIAVGVSLQSSFHKILKYIGPSMKRLQTGKKK